MKPSCFVEELTLKRVIDSYKNPRLENPEKDYLSADHIEQLQRDSEILSSWNEYAEPEMIPGYGTLRRFGIITQQGYAYDTLVGIPEIPQSETPIIGTTAWTTSLEGHNEYVIRNFIKEGKYVMFVGAEGSYVAEKPPTPSSPITLANSAATVLSFSKKMGDKLISEGHRIDPVLRDLFGESRGGMVGEGIDALAEKFDQYIAAADQVAPCFPKKIESIGELVRALEQLGREPLEISKLLGKMTVARLFHHRNTVDLRPSCVRDQLIIVGALVNGETGEMARRTPRNTLKHITAFDKDSISMLSEWQRIYDGSQQTRITPLPGSHLTIADNQTLEYVLARLKATILCEQQGIPLIPENVYGITANIVENNHKEEQARKGRKVLSVANSFIGRKAVAA